MMPPEDGPTFDPVDEKAVPESRTTVRILYKSGNSIDVECKSLKVTRDRATSEITGLEWDTIDPYPLASGLANIEAVWEL